ncbi:TPR-like protein [Fistulina hepatica ATCC 64428]|uniref:TPR-like protein n=1 Tax=Fistulina hepatica ATCC 64428 TaxID=1128425 RepID=A0A0D7A598_9AGAR|nr:TPR-like protein [Fistulina hepatica ATCC 64428]
MDTTSRPLPQPRNDLDLSSFDNIPLFMKSLPTDIDSDAPGGVALEALQSLVHEGPPDEIAENFKEQGNEYFKSKRYRDAMSFYTQGIDAKPTDITLLEALLCNRAACNLELQNYGSVLKDTAQVLSVNPCSQKAHYRATLALERLRRFDDALDCCNHLLKIDANNTVGQSALQRLRRAKVEQEREERIKREAIEKKRRLRSALIERSLKIIENPNESSINLHEPHFDDQDATAVVFPVFFLYPQYPTSDIIPQFLENVPFGAHLDRMFPKTSHSTNMPFADWDVKRQYTLDNINVYAMTSRGRLLKVGKKMCLRDIFKAAKKEEKEGLELKDGCLTFVVLPKGSDVEKRWIDDWKSKVANGS